ncbi:alpha/beta fold hydrolase [Flindersiella endophytica]
MHQTRKARLATGITVPYIEQGDPGGSPVVLLHAWAESSASFDRLLPLLPAGLRLLAPDLRGHGHADRPADGYTLAEIATDVEAFLDAASVRSAVLLGSSSGGYVAQQVAVSAPDRVAGLVLVGAPRSLQGRPPFAEEVERLTDPVDRAWVRDSLAWFPVFHEVPAWYVEDRIDDGAQMPAHVWRASLAGLCAAVPPTEAGTITAPTIVIWGGRDDLLPREDAERLRAAIPGSRLAVYDDTGHLVLWEQPERVARDAAALVASVTTG